MNKIYSLIASSLLLALAAFPVYASQNDYVISDGTGAAVLTDLSGAFQAAASTNKGNSAPSTVYTGQMWLDGDTPSATTWALSMYDGADWISLGTLNTTANTWAPSGAFPSRTITGTTAQISIANGDGSAGNPTISLPSAVQFGQFHTLSGIRSAILGGSGNSVTGNQSVIAGGASNQSSAANSFVSGDSNNCNGGNYCAIVGGTGSTIAGNYSVIAGGNAGTIDGNYNFIGGGDNNIIDNVSNSAIISGANNTIDGSQYSFIVGEQSDITTFGDHNVAMGAYNSIAGTNVDSSFAFANSATVSKSYAVAIGEAPVADKYAQFVHASGYSVQASQLLVMGTTTNNTQTELFLGDGTSRITIPTDTVWTFDILVTARRTTADNESAGYRIIGVIDNNAGTTALVGSITVTTIGEDNAAWDVTAQADNTNDALVIKVTGETSKTIKWGAVVHLVEVTG